MQTLAVVDTRYKSMIMSCNADYTDIKTIHSDYSFQTFLKKDMQLHKHCKRIILQRSCISENDDELSELLDSCKSSIPTLLSLSYIRELRIKLEDF